MAIGRGGVRFEGMVHRCVEMYALFNCRVAWGSDGKI